MSDHLKEGKNNIYVELKELDQRIKNINNHISNVDDQISELNFSKDIIHKFKDLEDGAELKVPLASGVYIDAKLDKSSKLLANVGSSVLVEKAPDEIIAILDTQTDDLNKYRKQLVGQLKDLINRAEQLQKQVQ